MAGPMKQPGNTRQDDTGPSGQAGMAGTFARGPSDNGQAVGLLPKTLVCTLAGMVPAVLLCPGDRIVTRDRGAVPLMAVRRRQGPVQVVRLTGACGARAAGSCLPAGQPLLLRGPVARRLLEGESALLPAATLLACGGAVPLGERILLLTQLFFGTPQIHYCDALELASADLPSVSLTAEAG